MCVMVLLVNNCPMSQELLLLGLDGICLGISAAQDQVAICKSSNVFTPVEKCRTEKYLVNFLLCQSQIRLIF